MFFCSWQKAKPSRNCDAIVGKNIVYIRPHARSFLKFCLDNFYVAFWSSGKRENIEPVINELFNEKELAQRKDVLGII